MSDKKNDLRKDKKKLIGRDLKQSSKQGKDLGKDQLGKAQGGGQSQWVNWNPNT